MRIYHGSEEIIEKPVYGKGKLRNDYGRGFYCTQDIELAKEWACGNGNNGYANCYELDSDNLKILQLDREPYNVLNWLAILTQNRTYWENSAFSEQAKTYLQRYFNVDISEYDVVVGYRANDSYFSFARDFVSNVISLRKLSEAMHLGELGEQVVLRSRKAYEQVSFLGYEEAEADIYFPRKRQRDEEAKRLYRQGRRKGDDFHELFMVDIMRGEIRNGDPRLQSGLFI